MLRVPAAAHRHLEEMPRGRHDPVGPLAGGQPAFQLQQQLGPFGQVTGLEAPGAEDVAAVVAVVVPVGRPVALPVLPDQRTVGRLRRGLRGQALRDRGRQRQRALQVLGVLRGVPRGQAGLAGVHVGVLAAVGRERLPVGRGLVGVQAVRGLPEARLHQREAGLQTGTGLLDAGHQRVRMRQQHEGLAVGVVRAVDHPRAGARCAAGRAVRIVLDHPGVAALGLGMRLVQEAQAVAHRLQPLRPALQVAPGHRVVEDEAGAADEVAGAPVVDRAVVAEEMEEASGRVDAAPVVEGHRVADVRAQDIGRAEVGQGGGGHGPMMTQCPRARHPGCSGPAGFRVRPPDARRARRPAPPAGPRPRAPAPGRRAGRARSRPGRAGRRRGPGPG